MPYVIDETSPVVFLTRIAMGVPGYRLVWGQDVYEGAFPDVLFDAMEDQGWKEGEDPPVALDAYTAKHIKPYVLDTVYVEEK